MAMEKTIIAENVQRHLEKSDWKAAIAEMEKLYAIDRAPLIRVRIGDVRLKLNRKQAAIREYLRAAKLFAGQGFVVKALAQYRLVLRLDSSNAYARNKMAVMEMLRPIKMVAKPQRAPMEYRVPPSFENSAPLYASRSLLVVGDEQAKEQKAFCHLDPAGGPELNVIGCGRDNDIVHERQENDDRYVHPMIHSCCDTDSDGRQNAVSRFFQQHCFNLEHTGGEIQGHAQK